MRETLDRVTVKFNDCFENKFSSDGFGFTMAPEL